MRKKLCVYFDARTQLLFVSMLVAAVIYTILPEVFPSPMFLLVNVFFAIQLTRRETIRAGVTRIAGTMLGSIIGLLLYLIMPEHILFVPLGIAISVYIGYFFLQTFTPVIAIIVIMLLSGGATQLPSEYIWQRLLATLIGVSVALAVSYCYRRQSRNSDAEFYDAAGKILTEMQEYVGCLLNSQASVPLPVHQFIPQLDQLRDIRRRLLDDSLTGVDDEDELMIITTRLADIYMHIQLLQRVGGTLDATTQLLAYKRYGIISGHRFSYPIVDDAVVNEHVQKILELFKEIETLLGNS